MPELQPRPGPAEAGTPTKAGPARLHLLVRMPDGTTIVLVLKVAVIAVTLLLLASLVALGYGRYRLHGRLNVVFFTLTVAAVVVFEGLIRLGPFIEEGWSVTRGW